MKFNDLGRGARIELSKMAKKLGMKFIGYDPAAQRVSLEYKGKGVTYSVEEFEKYFEEAGVAS